MKLCGYLVLQFQACDAAAAGFGSWRRYFLNVCDRQGLNLSARPTARGATRPCLYRIWFANVKKRIIFWSAFAGYVIGFFARTTFNPVLEYFTPAQGCLLGAGPYWNAVLMVAPQNGILYGMVGAFIAATIRLAASPKSAIPGKSSKRGPTWVNVLLFCLIGFLLLPFVILLIGA